MPVVDSAFPRVFRALVVVLSGALLSQCSESTAPQNNPTPVLGAANPANVIAGAASATVTLTGEGFVSASRVRWNGADRATTFVNATTLTVQLTTQDLASSGSAALTVYNPPPGGGTSGTLSFMVDKAVPPPHIVAVYPGVAYVGTALRLFVRGNSFTPNSVLRWNGSDRPTTVLDSTALLAQISASDLAAPATASITVFNSEPGSGLSSAASLPIVAVPAATHPSATFSVAYLMTGRPHGVSVAPSGRFYVSLIDGNAVRRGSVDPNGESFAAAPLSYIPAETFLVEVGRSLDVLGRNDDVADLSIREIRLSLFFSHKLLTLYLNAAGQGRLEIGSILFFYNNLQKPDS